MSMVKKQDQMTTIPDKASGTRFVETLADGQDYWMSLTDAARVTRTSEAMARRWVRSGRLPVKREPVGINQRTRLVRASDLAQIRPIIDPTAAITDQIHKLDLLSIPLTEPRGNPIDLYFSFRERFLALKTAFGISTWELEQFLLWQKQQEQKREKAVALAVQKSEQISLRNEGARRLHVQWLLAKMGRKVGCQVWIARPDHEKSWKEDVLGQLSVPILPALENVSSATLLDDVAVLWLLKEEVIAVFEIALNKEDIIPSLLRLYDLSLTLARRRIRFCLVLPNQHFEHVHRAFSRPLFRQQQERHQCALISEESLAEHGEHILRWATSPTVIEDIIAFPVV